MHTIQHIPKQEPDQKASVWSRGYTFLVQWKIWKKELNDEARLLHFISSWSIWASASSCMWKRSKYVRWAWGGNTPCEASLYQGTTHTFTHSFTPWVGERKPERTRRKPTPWQGEHVTHHTDSNPSLRMEPWGVKPLCRLRNNSAQHRVLLQQRQGTSLMWIF